MTKIEDYAIFDCSEFYRLNISGDAPGLGEIELFLDDSEDIMICVPKDAKGYEKESWNAYKMSYDFNENQIENVSAVSESEFHSLNLTGALTEQDFLYMEKGVVNDALEYVNTGTIIYLYYEEGQYPDKKSVVETARGICIGDSKEKVFDATLEENLKTRGALNIYFYNNEYIDKVDENLEYKADCLFFYNERHSLYGVIVSKEEPSPYTTTFPPGNYTFYSKYLDVEGQFTITEPGEFLDLEVDYKTRTYKISYDS